MIVGFTTLQSRLFFPIGSMLQVSTEVQSSLALFDRIFEYLDLKHDITDAPDAMPLDDVRGGVRLDHVRFHYEAGEAPSELDLATPASGRSTTFPSRSSPDSSRRSSDRAAPGKTTITYLVPRMYDVNEGAVRIDGHDVRSLTLDSIADNDRDRHAGDVPVPRHGPAQPALRPSGRDAGGARGGGARR